MTTDSSAYRHLSGAELRLSFPERVRLFSFGATAACGGLLFGFNSAAVAGALVQLNATFALTDIETSLIISVLSFGSLGGCSVGGYVSDKIGRWRSMMLQNLLYAVAAITLAAAGNLPTIYAGRFLCGVAYGVSVVADVPYLNEISPSHYRGRLSCFYELEVVFGTVLGGIMSLLCLQLDGGWRVLFAIPLVIVALNSIMLCFVPESPKWLIMKGRRDEARKVLMLILSKDECRADLEMRRIEFAASIDSVGSQANSRTNSTNNGSTTAADSELISQLTYAVDSTLAAKSKEAKLRPVKLLLATEYRWPMTLVITLMVLSSCTGSVVIRNFAPTIFQRAGFSYTEALVLNLVISVVNALFVVACTALIDKRGRRAPLLLGIAVTFAGTAILSAGFFSGLTESIPLYLTGCLLTTIGFSVGFGTVGWIIATELFPTVVRGRALSISTVVRNLSEFVANTLLLVSISQTSAGHTFAVFALFCVVSGVFVWSFLVETQEKEPSEILGDLLMRYQMVVGLKCLGKKTPGEESDGADAPLIGNPMINDTRITDDVLSLSSNLPTHGRFIEGEQMQIRASFTTASERI